MGWFNRIVVLTLILCLSRAPLPWGHSHNGMDAEQLATHLRSCHSATNLTDLPQGWHWHFTPIALATGEGSARSFDIFIEARQSDARLIPTPDESIRVSVRGYRYTSRPTWTNISWVRAVRQQQSYLRHNVFLT